MPPPSEDPARTHPAVGTHAGPDVTAQILERLNAHGTKQSRYVQKGEVARGGMGMILRVWDEDLRRELAMKVVLGESGSAKTNEIPPKVLGRFLEEAQVTGQLDHPGIVPVHELGLDDRGAVFFTMRLVRGRDLKELFDLVHAGDKEWTQTRILWALLKVCDAMAYAHSKGVIHRDLKPANVMVGRFGEVYVMDWGLARVLGQPDRHDLRLRQEASSLSMVESERRADASHSADSVLFTMDGDVVGTPAYMAPEQARGEIEHLGPRSDVYSLGAMLYHLLTGEMPFVAPGARVSQHMVLRWALEGPPRPVRALRAEVPDELVAICERAMARDPAQRYADMGELGEDLRAFLENRVVRAHRRGAWIEFKKWVERNRALAAAWGAVGLVTLLGLGATAWVQVHGRRVAERERARAVAGEQAAQTNLAEAQRQEAIAKRERSNVLRLSAFQELDELERDADALWPAEPGRIDAFRAWLTRAASLVAGLESGADGDPGHRKQLEELRARAHVLTPGEQARLAATHPRGPELIALQRKVAALRAAEEARAHGATRAGLALEAAAGTEGDAQALNTRAWALVDPARGEYGREREGLALASLAWERATPAERYLIGDTLAWAELANGLDDEAFAASRAALEAAPMSSKPEYEEYLTRIAQAVRHAESPAGAAELRTAELALADLEREVLGGPVTTFQSDDDRWWHDQLETLVRSIEAFADPEQGLVRGLSPRHGWGVERRLAFASTLAERTRDGADARARWNRAVEEVRASPFYRGLALAPQLGLLPLGADPQSGLQEFADLATGEPPVRRQDGRLEPTPGSGAVFVLLPGGEFELGAQREDPSLPNYDPGARLDERPVQRVRLDPFFCSKYELTQGQWQRFTGRRTAKLLAGTVLGGKAIDGSSPLESVTWFEAERELARLGWLLPSEAQWEYAARGGTETPWWTGEEPGSLAGAANLSDRFARAHGALWPDVQAELDDGYWVHAPVGRFEPNPFGLADVLGNVFEWCRDDFGDYTQPVAPVDGERRGGNPATRPLRGGAYSSDASHARVARRESAPPELQNETIGVRPVRALTR